MTSLLVLVPEETGALALVAVLAGVLLLRAQTLSALLLLFGIALL